jgi:hypothetical protein
MRHLIGIALAIVMILVMFFAGAWGYLRLLRLPVPGNALTALPAHGGSLLSYSNVLAALGAVAATGVLAGILVATPRISPLAAGLSGMLLIGWTALYLASVRRAVGLIPLRTDAFGSGWEAMLFNGILGGAGLAMIVPVFPPSRWRRRADPAADSETIEAPQFAAGLKESAESPSSAPAVPAGSLATRPIRSAEPGRPRPSSHTAGR